MASSGTTDIEQLERVRELRAGGSSPKEIAKALGVRPAVAAQLVRQVARQAVEANPEPGVVGCWVSEGWSAGLAVAGDDNPRAVIRTLTEPVGEGNFDVVAQI